MEQFQHAFAVAQDRLVVLNDIVGRQPAVLYREAHGAARHRHTQTQRARFLDLDVDRVLEARRKQIVMVGSGRAAGKQKFDQRHAHREAQLVGPYPSPDRIERDEPGDQIRLQAGRMRANQRLIEMMVGVDEAGKHDVARGVEGLVDRKRRHSPSTDEFDDARPLDHQAAFRARPEQGERDP